MTKDATVRKDKKPTERRKKKARKPTYRETKADNEASVRTNSKLFNLSSWIDVIEDELGMMNEEKRGRPYAYCTSMILWVVSIMGYNNLTFRKAAGAAAGVLEERGRKAPHYSTIHRRSASLAEEMLNGPEGRFISSYIRPRTGQRKRRIAIDSTGLNLSKTTLWRENKYGVGPKWKGWLKVHAAVDIDSGEILAYILSDDLVGDNTAFIPLMRMLLKEGYDIRVVFADNAYEASDNWKFLHEAKIKFIVKFKSNTSGNSNGCMDRGESAQLWIMLGEKKWKKVTGYGMRWKVECAFSDFKRLVAETVSAVSPKGIAREILAKVKAYNEHKRIRADVVSITGNDILVAED